MDKKLLVSLMMTAPVATFAAEVQWVADGNGDLSYQIKPAVDSDNWKADGISDYVTTDGVLSCPVSTGFLSHNMMLSAVGSYTFVAQDVTNAHFEVDGKVQYKKNDKGQYLDNGNNVTTNPDEYVYATTFAVTNTAKVIKVVPNNNEYEFKIGVVNITLDFNFATAKSNLQTQFNKIVLTQVPDADTRQNAKNLREQLKTLTTDYNNINKNITSIDLDSPDALLNAWKNFNLAGWTKDLSKATDKVSEAIRNLQSAAGLADADGKYPASSYNGKVAAETEAWNNIKTNETNLAAINAKIAQLKKDLDAKKDVEKTVPTTATADEKAYCKLALAEELATEQTAITNLETAVNAAYPKDSEGNLPTTVVATTDLDTTAGNISTAIAAITAAYAIADYQAYVTFTNAVNDLAYQYNKIFGQINDNYRVTEYSINGKTYTCKNVYDDVTGDANNALAEAYKKNTGYDITAGAIVDGKFVDSEFKDIINARNLLADAKAEIAKRLKGMQDAEAALKKIYERQQAQLNGTDGTPDSSFAMSANAIITGLQGMCDDYKTFAGTDAFKALTDADQTKLNELIDAMQTAIDNLVNVTNTQYLAHDLNVNADPFLAAEKVVTDADEAYNNYLTKNIGQSVIDLIISSNDARDYVKTETAKVTGYGDTLNSKFDSSFKNIDDAISKYYASNPKDQQAVTDIENAIKDVKLACDKLVDGFSKALTAINAQETALKDFKKQLDDKTRISTKVGTTTYAAYDKQPDVTKYNGFETTVNKYKTELNDAVAIENVQEAYEAAVEEANKVNTENLAASITAAQDAFVKAATAKNSENVGALIDDIDKYVNQDPYKSYPGMSKVDLVKDVEGGFTSVVNLYNTEKGKIAGAGADTTKLDAIDKALKGIVDKCADVNAAIDNVLANNAAYEALCKLKNQYETSISTYRSNLPNNELTVQPAINHYIEELGKLLKELTDIETEYVASYNAIEEVAKQADYEAKIKAVNTKFGDLQKDLLENQKNFSVLNGIADGLSTTVNEVNDQLNGYDGDDDKGNVSEIVEYYTKKYQQQVADLTQELGNLNDAVTATFGEGGLTDSSLVADYKDQYNKLQKELQSIVDNWTDGYYGAVVEANEAWLSQHNLGDGSLDEKYKNAIAYVNEYLYNVYNVAYYPMLTNNDVFIANHNELQACFKKIETLTSQLIAYKLLINPPTIVGDEESYNPELQKVLGVDILSQNESESVTVEGVKVTLKSLEDAANNIVDTIEKTIAAIDEEGLKQANKFWDENGDPAYNVWRKIRTRLAAAGLSVDSRGEQSELDAIYGEQLSELNTIVNAHDEAIDEIGTATTGKLVHKYILYMDKWANKLVPSLIPSYDPDSDAQTAFENTKVYSAINTVWPDRVSDADAEIKNLSDEIEKYALNTTDYAGQLQKVTDAQDLVNNLNYAWSNLSNSNKEANLKDYQSQIDAALEAARQAVKDASDAYGIYVANNVILQAAIAAYNTGVGNIDKLLEWSSYRTDQLTTIEGLRTALDDAKTEVENDVKNSSTTLTESVEVGKINAKGVTAVNNAYVTVFGQEKAFAQAKMVELRTAFNNVNVNGGADTDQLNLWDEQIKTLESDLSSCIYKANDKDGCMNKLKGYEEDISALLVTLQNLAIEVSGETITANTKASTLEALNTTADGVTSTINKFKAAVSGAEIVGEGTNVKALQQTYNGKLATFETELSGIETAYNGNGDNVIQNAAKFTYDMQQLLADITNAEGEWNTAYNNTGTPKGALQKDINVHYYGSLSADLTSLWNETLYAANQAKTHTNTAWDSAEYESIDHIINGWTDEDGYFHEGEKQKLQNLYDNCGITKSTSLKVGLQDQVYGFVRQTLKLIADDELDAAKTQANELVNDIQKPGVNENGWQQRFINEEDLWRSIVAELRVIENLNLWTILYNYDETTEDQTPTTPKQAKTAYESIMEKIDEGRANMGDIYDQAVADNLIVKGDANSDSKVNVLDVQALIDLVLDDAVVEKDDKKTNAADVNEDGDLNMGDVTLLINWIIEGQDNPSNPASIVSRLRKFMPAMTGSNSYLVEEVQGENGLRRFAVLLTNETAFAAGQMQVFVPSHARIANITLGERANGLDLYSKDHGDHTTIAFTSLDNTLIEGNNGCVLFIDVEGNAEIEVENVIFSDKNGTAYKLNGNSGTGVGIMDAVKDGVKAIYNAAGQKLNKLTKGVNIVRNADGSVTKKIGK